MTESEKLLKEEVDFLDKELYNANWIIDRVVKLFGDSGTHLGSIQRDMELLQRYRAKYGELED